MWILWCIDWIGRKNWGRKHRRDSQGNMAWIWGRCEVHIARIFPYKWKRRRLLLPGTRNAVAPAPQVRASAHGRVHPASTARVGGHRVPQHHAEGVAPWAWEPAQGEDGATSTLAGESGPGLGNSPSYAVPARAKAQTRSPRLEAQQHFSWWRPAR